MNKKLTAWLTRSLAAASAALAAYPVVTRAQNCALCYTQAAGSGSRMIQALRSGILMLAIPPMLICMGITWMAYKKRNQFHEDPPAFPRQEEPRVTQQN